MCGWALFAGYIVEGGLWWMAMDFVVGREQMQFKNENKRKNKKYIQINTKNNNKTHVLIKNKQQYLNFNTIITHTRLILLKNFLHFFANKLKNSVKSCGNNLLV